MNHKDKRKHKVIISEPSTLVDFDQEVTLVESETWKEVLEKLEDILEEHFMERGWNGELKINLKFDKLTDSELGELIS